jgi:signal transduction histidine kinase
VGLGYILLDLAMGEQRKKNLKGALHFIEQSTVIRKKIGDQQGIAINLMTIADTYVAFQQYTKAIPYFEKGLQEAYKVGYDDLVRYGYDHLSEAYILMKDFQSAYLSQKKAHAFNDSLFNIERTKVIADLQTKYETEKKEQELALQRATVAEQKAELEKNFAVIAALAVTLVLLSVIFFLVRNRFRRKQDLLKKEHDLSLRDGLIRASIQSQEIERKRFAQDLHDGMGQLISSLRLSVARMGFEADTKERVNIFSKSEKILNDMHQEIRSIAFNLMPQTLIQFGLIPALEEMAQRVSASGKIIVNVKGFDIPQRLAEVQEISLYRVIQEWVNNITKYSDATAVEVQLVGYESEITVIVEDNGNGFDTSVLAAGKGHGWRNIQSRLNLIRSTVEVDSRAGVKGTTMIIHLPFQKESVQEENVEAGHDRM